jgi:hypothetical protein
MRHRSICPAAMVSSGSDAPLMNEAFIGRRLIRPVHHLDECILQDRNVPTSQRASEVAGCSGRFPQLAHPRSLRPSARSIRRMTPGTVAV